MKKVLLLLALTIAAPFSTQAANPPSKVAIAYERVYAPAGFDSNDQVQIVGTGQFSTGCYRHAETVVDIDTEKKTITLGPAAYKYNGFCLQLATRFERVIELGILPAGDYEIYQKNHSKRLGVLNVKEATSDEPDDFMYAPISQAFLESKGDSNELIVTGEFPSSCMRIQAMKVESRNDVIVVQPIAELVRDNDCALGYYPFREVLPMALPKGRYLLHIRSMNAKAINSLVEMR